MKLLSAILFVLMIEYTFGATGGEDMRLGLVNETVIPNEFNMVAISQPSLSADDMLKTISAIDVRYDYTIYKSFNDQFIVVAFLKGQKDTIIDMQYMSIATVTKWYNEKLDEFLGRGESDV